MTMIHLSAERLYEVLRHVGVDEREARTAVDELVTRPMLEELVTKDFLRAELRGLESRLLRWTLTLMTAQTAIFSFIVGLIQWFARP